MSAAAGKWTDLVWTAGRSMDVLWKTCASRAPTRSKEIIAYQGVIFKSEGENDKTLYDLLDGKMGAMTYQYDGPEDKFKKALQHQVQLRARSNLEKLKTSHRRLNELKAAVMSTQEELEHVNDHVEKLSTETTSNVHAMEVHASLINEMLWETKAVADAVVELQTAFAQVENEAKKIDQKIGGITHEIERQRLAAVKVENDFRQIESAIAWIDESIENFAIGLATMSMERLLATLFPPLQVQAVLRDIKAILPAGWSLSPSVQAGDTWKVFTLYEVISLPRPVNNSTQGAQFHPLPSFLAVAGDRQAFVELPASDSSRCLSSTTSICPISRVINRKHRESSCAMALFLKDDKKSRMQCSTRLAQWTGQQTVYLGHRRWGYSTDQETTITITCPNGRGKTSTLIKREPFDVFEVPMAYTAHTDDWIFQASLKKNVRHSLNNESLPSLAELEEVGKVPQEPDSNEIEPVIEPEMENWKHKPPISRRVTTKTM
ncbi:Uncharacterized protein APZ42_027525 [Daphnia magna]|uniref:Uncharacterized protein n=1 Tax=Daphnia magna TaxID=35525 RepID=A0A164RA03_9CRUS|nr:Uncharacterized protein APZ42_027525 [Daphnia magna]